MLKLNLA